MVISKKDSDDEHLVYLTNFFFIRIFHYYLELVLTLISFTYFV